MKNFTILLLLSFIAYQSAAQTVLKSGTILLKDIRSDNNEEPLKYVVYTDMDSTVFKVKNVTQENVDAKMTELYEELDVFLGDLAEDREVHKIIIDYYPPKCIGGVFESMEMQKTQIGTLSDAMICLTRFKGAKVLQVIWDDCHYLPSRQELNDYELYEIDENFAGSDKEMKKEEKRIARENERIKAALDNIDNINKTIKANIEQKYPDHETLHILVQRRD